MLDHITYKHKISICPSQTQMTLQMMQMMCDSEIGERTLQCLHRENPNCNTTSQPGAKFAITVFVTHIKLHLKS